MLSQTAKLRDYFELCKPRVVALMLLTAVIGMHLATNTWVPWTILVFGTVGIALCAGSAATVNHIIDRHIDSKMGRTHRRPIPRGRVTPREAYAFAAVMGILGLVMLWVEVNPLTALLTFLTLLGYAVIYTLFLKHVTPQNIVIGGLAGAAPPLLGWVAVTGHLDPHALLLTLIIFTWTPPHFWALAIHRLDEYVKADVPMLPVTHGVAFTKLCILLYTLLLLAVTLLPFVVHLFGLIYLIGSLVLNFYFLYLTMMLKKQEDTIWALKTFRYSIVYLALLFALMLIDHYMAMI